MNYVLLDRPTQLLLSQANQRLRLLIDELQNGTLTSTAGLQAAAATLFTQFYENLGLPLSTPMQFQGLPAAEGWNSYQQLLAADLSILYRQAQSLATATEQQLALAQIETSMLAGAAASLDAKVKALKPTRVSRGGQHKWTVAETFGDTTKIDAAASTNLTVLPGTIELARAGQIDVSQNINLTIDDTYIAAAHGLITTGLSNGFPGNLHEVSATENTNTLTAPAGGNAIAQAVQLNAAPGTTLAFVGDGDLHADVRALTDGNPATWFEYEVCNLPDTLKSNPALGYGFTLTVPQLTSASPQAVPWYDFHDTPTTGGVFPPLPGTAKLPAGAPELTASGQYATASGAAVIDPLTGRSSLTQGGQSLSLAGGGAPPSGGTLRLALVGTFAQPQMLTHIAILPHILANKPPRVVSVEVRSADAAAWINATLASADVPATASIDTVASSGETLQTWVIPETTVATVRIIIEQNQSYTTQLGHLVWVDQQNAGGTADPTIFDAMLGQSVQLSSATGPSYSRIDGPNPSLSNILADKKTVLETIDGISAYQDGSSAIVGPLIEVFSGWRYAIALRDISFQAISYVNTGTLTSRELQVPIDIKKISLQVREYVPAGGQPIVYEISVDGGQRWVAIAPQSHYSAKDPRSYLVNPAGGVSGSGTLTTTGPVSSVRLRATFSRPDGNTALTPRLYGYNLILEGNSL